MSHYRKDLRDAAKAAIAGHAALSGYNVFSAWSQNIDAGSLPAFGVATPREDKTLDGLDASERNITLIVVFKRKGGDDLEDVLDDDSIEAEIALLPALAAIIDATDLTGTEIRIDGDGASRVGTLTMTFRSRHWLIDPIS